MSGKPPKQPRKTAHTHTAAGTSAAGQPVFAQPQPSPDPTGFKNPVTDQSDKELANVEAVPQPVGGASEPILTLAQVYGSAGTAKTASHRTGRTDRFPFGGRYREHGRSQDAIAGGR